MARLATSLSIARATIDARWPQRDRASDGWIGDAAHAMRNSDHNPNERGVVDALDIDMAGGVTPVHRPSIVAGFMLHPAINYVIYNRRIWSRSRQFQTRAYDGINPHTGHCHGSVLQEVWAENTTITWPVLRGFPNWPTMREGHDGPQARELQAFLNAWGAALILDGEFGPATGQSVVDFQTVMGIRVDGIVGAQTRGKLFG